MHFPDSLPVDSLRVSPGPVSDRGTLGDLEGTMAFLARLQGGPLTLQPGVLFTFRVFSSVSGVLWSPGCHSPHDGGLFVDEEGLKPWGLGRPYPRPCGLLVPLL